MPGPPEGIVAPPTADGIMRDLPHPDRTFWGGSREKPALTLCITV